MIINQLKNCAIKFCILCLSVMASCAGDSGSGQKGSVTSDQQTGSVYKCPMECEGEKTYGKAGICPVCEMDLEKTEVTPTQKKVHIKMDSAVLDTTRK